MAEGTPAPDPVAGSPGALIARLLTGAWRPSPPALDLTVDELARIAPLLFKSGAAALVWWRLPRFAPRRCGDDPRSPASVPPRHARRRAPRDPDRGDPGVPRGRLRAIAPGQGVGGGAALPGARVLLVHTDVDLIVPRGELARAREALAAGPPLGEPVDIHDGPGLLDLSYVRRARRPRGVGAGQRHGRPDSRRRRPSPRARATRTPAWAVPATLAGRPRRLRGKPSRGIRLGSLPRPHRRRAEWVTGAVALAHRLLGARLTETPVAGRAARLPRWLVRAVLRSWDRCEGVSHRPRVFQSFLGLLRQPGRLRDEVRLRWDRPIQATLDVNGCSTGSPGSRSSWRRRRSASRS